MRRLRIVRARRPVAAATLGLAIIALVAAGAATAILLLPEGTPSSVAGPTGERTVAVASRGFDDPQPVTVTPELSDAMTLTLSEYGRVTRTKCAPGAVIGSGTSPITVDDRPVIALATGVPLWRDLGLGVRGEDVRALQRELSRLGYGVSVTGYYGSQTRAAVNGLLKKVGVIKPSGTLLAASVIWLPAPRVTVSSCEVVQAQSVSPGAFAKVDGGLKSLQVTDEPPSAVAGDRVLRYQGLTAPIDADGLVTDPQFLTAVAAGGEFTFATSAQGQGTLELISALATPLAVVVVPPAALFGLSGGDGCVVADGTPRRVRVVSSSLGQTMITFDGGFVPAQVSLPEPGQAAGGCS